MAWKYELKGKCNFLIVSSVYLFGLSSFLRVTDSSFALDSFIFLFQKWWVITTEIWIQDQGSRFSIGVLAVLRRDWMNHRIKIVILKRTLLSKSLHFWVYTRKYHFGLNIRSLWISNSFTHTQISFNSSSSKNATNAVRINCVHAHISGTPSIMLRTWRVFGRGRLL